MEDSLSCAKSLSQHTSLRQAGSAGRRRVFDVESDLFGVISWKLVVGNKNRRKPLHPLKTPFHCKDACLRRFVRRKPIRLAALWRTAQLHDTEYQASHLGLTTLAQHSTADSKVAKRPSFLTQG